MVPGALFSSVLRLSVSCGFVLLSLRVVYTETEGYVFLLWNLALAAFPYLISVFFERGVRKNPTAIHSSYLFVLAATWFFFFPNAPYIVTDFVHIPWQYITSPSVIFDAALVFWFSMAGFLFGMGSLFRMHRAIEKQCGGTVSHVFAVSAILLSGIGIYLGRVLRWNSWDVLFNPIDIFRDVLSHMNELAGFEQSAIFSMSLSFLVGISYALFLGAYRWVASRARS